MVRRCVSTCGIDTINPERYTQVLEQHPDILFLVKALHFSVRQCQTALCIYYNSFKPVILLYLNDRTLLVQKSVNMILSQLFGSFFFFFKMVHFWNRAFAMFSMFHCKLNIFFKNCLQMTVLFKNVFIYIFIYTLSSAEVWNWGCVWNCMAQGYLPFTVILCIFTLLSATRMFPILKTVEPVRWGPQLENVPHTDTI